MVNDPTLANNPVALAFESQELTYVSQAINNIVNQTSTVTISSPPVIQPLTNQTQGQINQTFGVMPEITKTLEFNTEDMGQYWNIYVTYKENGERKDANIILGIDAGVISGCQNIGQTVTCQTNPKSSNGAARFIYKVMDYTTIPPTKSPVGTRTLTATANGVTATTTINVR